MLQPRSLTAGTLSIWINLTGFLACSLLSWKKLKKCNDRYDSGSTGSTSEQGTSFAAEGDMQSRQCTRLQVSLQFVLLGAERDPISLCSTHCELSKKHQETSSTENSTECNCPLVWVGNYLDDRDSFFHVQHFLIICTKTRNTCVPQVLWLSVHLYPGMKSRQSSLSSSPERPSNVEVVLITSTATKEEDCLTQLFFLLQQGFTLLTATGHHTADTETERVLANSRPDHLRHHATSINLCLHPTSPSEALIAGFEQGFHKRL